MSTQRPTGRLGPAELVQLTTVARRFHLDQRTKVQIADEFGLSRFKVARLLERAQAEGLVRIEIGRPAEIDTDLSEAVRSRLGLAHAIVADVHDDDLAAIRREVARVAADHLGELTEPGDVVGLAWGRALHELTTQLGRLPQCVAVQLCGALPRTDVDASSVDITRRLADAAHGSAVTFYAPLLVPDADTAAALRGEPGIAEALAHYPRLSVAVVSIGAWEPELSTVYDALTEDERAALRDAGAVAETCGIVLAADGQPLEPGLRDRVIGVSPDELRTTDRVVAIAYGDQKADAVRVTRRAGIGTSLVTHTALAKRLLAED
ncbi:MAG: transcriptional regulator [Streptosporangiales bacterium]|nr:transcriptional regulator [Streptosporangiales bacterium]